MVDFVELAGNVYVVADVVVYVLEVRLAPAKRLHSRTSQY
jgi:hypothetical protein